MTGRGVTRPRGSDLPRCQWLQPHPAGADGVHRGQSRPPTPFSEMLYEAPQKRQRKSVRAEQSSGGCSVGRGLQEALSREGRWRSSGHRNPCPSGDRLAQGLAQGVPSPSARGGGGHLIRGGGGHLIRDGGRGPSQGGQLPLTAREPQTAGSAKVLADAGNPGFCVKTPNF